MCNSLHAVLVTQHCPSLLSPQKGNFLWISFCMEQFHKICVYDPLEKGFHTLSNMLYRTYVIQNVFMKKNPPVFFKLPVFCMKPSKRVFLFKLRRTAWNSVKSCKVLLKYYWRIFNMLDRWSISRSIATCRVSLIYFAFLVVSFPTTVAKMGQCFMANIFFCLFWSYCT